MNIERKRAIGSFTIFLILMIKWYLVNVLEMIPVYGGDHRLISWSLVLPLSIVGLILSFMVLWRSFRASKKNYGNILLAIPMLLFVFYFFILGPF